MRWWQPALAAVAAAATATAVAVAMLGSDGDQPGPDGPVAVQSTAAVHPPDPRVTGLGGPDPRATGLGGLEPSLDASAARTALAGLPVAAEVLTGYDRDAFGAAWSDVEGNGCNQRDDVLLRDALPGTARTASQGACDHDVLAGQWLDPYTGDRLSFDDLKDEQQAQAIPIDHLVPLSEAHRSGAYAWTLDRRLAFANDLGNLVAVGGSENSAKGDGDPARWLPPAAVRCNYAAVWVDVKSRWRLAVDATEKAVLVDLLDGC